MNAYRSVAQVPLRAVSYARVSSKEQEKEGFSIPAQTKLIEEYAREHSIIVVQRYVDVETAKRAGRRGFGEMVAFLRKNRASCRAILVEKTDRLYRNLKDWVTLDELGVEIHFVKEGQIISDGSRSSDKLLHGIKVLMAKNYIDNLSEETRKGMNEKAAEGLYPGYAPLGYRNVVGASGKRIIEADPNLAPLVARVFELYVSDNLSLKEVARRAKQEGLVFRASGQPVPTSTIHKILRNPIYTGRFRWKGKVHKGTHAPLVDTDLWERAQTVLSTRFGKRHKTATHDFAFSGFVTCGHCGSGLVGEKKKERYVYYHCTGHKGKCPEPYVREERLAEHFAKVLERIKFDDDVIAWVAEALKQSHADEKKYHDEAVARLQAEYTRLQGRLDEMYIDKLDGRITQEFFDRKASEWRLEQDNLMRAITNHQSANRTYVDEGARLLELASRASELYAKQTPHEKRRLLDCVVRRASWRNGTLDVAYRPPFDILAVSNPENTAKDGRKRSPAPEIEIWGG